MESYYFRSYLQCGYVIGVGDLPIWIFTSKIGEKRFPDFTNNPPFEVKIFEVKKVLISTFTKSSEILSLRFGMYTPLIRIVYLVVNTLTSIKV